MPTVEERVDEMAEDTAKWVETKLSGLGDAISSIVAKGLDYEIKVMKNGKPVQNVPLPIVAIMAGIGILPPVRILTLIALAGAAMNGYTFEVREKTPQEPPKP